MLYTVRGQFQQLHFVFFLAGLSREYESVQCFNGELAISLKSVKLQFQKPGKISSLFWYKTKYTLRVVASSPLLLLAVEPC